MTEAIERWTREVEEVSDALTELQRHPIEDAEMFQIAADILRGVKTTRGEIKAERVKITSPLRQAWVNANDLFDRVDAKYEQAETQIKGRIAAFDAAQKERERAAIAAAAANNDHAALLAIQSTPVAQGVTVREILDFEVVDPSQIPRQFLVPDERLIRETIKSSKGLVPIPGVRIFKKSSVAARKG